MTMTPEEFIKELQGYLKSLQMDHSVGGWIYKGETDTAYGSPGGTIDFKSYKGYLFKRDEKSFVLRPYFNQEGVIAIESVHHKAQSFIFILDDIHFKAEGEKVQIMDNFTLTAGVRRPQDVVRDEMVKLGANEHGIIYAGSNRDFVQFIFNLFEWALLREEVRSRIRKSDKRFAEIINQLNGLIKIQWRDKIRLTKQKKRFAQFGDTKGIIGNKKVHYEVRMYKDLIRVDLHFEGTKKEGDLMRQKLDDLPKNIEWFKWESSSSLTLKPFTRADTPNIGSILNEQLAYLENNIGDQVRKIMVQHDLTDKSNNLQETNSKSKMKQPLNQILYGPPGTGKTYNAIIEAVKIANPDFEIDQEWEEIKKEYDHLMEKGKIVFTTFHQSMNYEDFVEGIKPQKPKKKGGQVWYKVEDGIFKSICSVAKVNSNRKIVLNKESVSNNVASYEGEKITKELFERTYKELASSLPLKDEGKQGMELRTVRDLPFYLTRNARGSISVRPHEGITNVNISLNHLRQIYYDGDKPHYVSYEPVIIKELVNRASGKVPSKDALSIVYTENNFVLIIDEINRGNVSAIFGELITLIEENKRAGKEEAITVELPYSKSIFSVPMNLYIIGTMNTADRSVEALDTALRRRFSFTEMPPQPQLIRDAGNRIHEITINGYKVDLVRVLQTINNRIEILLDKDHLIGHSFFMKVKDEATLRLAFSKEIIPLMQEYFYGDYGKISLVLGEGFCSGNKVSNASQGDSQIFSKISNEYDASSFMEKTIYTIQDPTNLGNAIKQLLNDPM